MRSMNDNIKLSLDILELSTNSTFEEAKQAYRDLVIVWHPDKHHTSNDRIKVKADLKLKQINSAWDVLKEYFSSRTAENNAAEERQKKEQAEKEAQQRRDKEQRMKQQAEQKRREEEAKHFIISKCPHCFVNNRIPRDKPIASATCGSCGKIIDPKAKAQLDREEATKKRMAEAAEQKKREKTEKYLRFRKRAVEETEEHGRLLKLQEDSKQPIIVPCPYCKTRNRVPRESNYLETKCGECGRFIHPKNYSKNQEQ